jgi:hypothetical protein
LGTINRIGDAIARLGAPHDGRHDLRRALQPVRYAVSELTTANRPPSRK